jgi:alpha-L-fucosidase
VREFTDACRAEGLRAGLYLSPWDRNATVYGDSPAYDAFYLAQLTELLTRYGPIHEVWFDGANGEGPNGRRQVYDWHRYWGTVRRLQPDAVMFSDAGPDVRWIGNERGVAGETNWSTVDPAIVPRPGMTGDEVMRSLTEGDRDGTVWRPGETDTSIRPGWFWHPEEDARVRSVDDLELLYFTSVGRNSKLLLNVPPTRDGVIHPTDAARLAAMRDRLDEVFGEPHAGTTSWSAGPGEGGTAGWVSSATAHVGVIDLRENIEQGQRVGRHVVEARTPGGWREVARGTTIGYRRLHRVSPVRLTHLRVRVDECTAPAQAIDIRLYPPG